MSDLGNKQINEILSRLEQVRPTRQGWIARCPAHPDRCPSLSLRVGERALLVKCFAGCSVQDICGAIGIKVKGLFWDASKAPEWKTSSVNIPRRPHWRVTATMLEQHAIGLHVRSEAVLEAARGLDTSNWSECDLDTAMQAVSSAYYDADRTTLLEEVAYSLRAKGLRGERRV